MGRVTQLAGASGVLACVQYADAAEASTRLATGVEAVRRAYQPFLGVPLQVSWRYLPLSRVGVVLLGAGGAEPSRTILWGRAVGPTGEAGTDVLHAALTDPQRHGRSLHGMFVLAHLGEQRVRLVTSPSLVHTLKRVGGPWGTAWSTRGWAAHLLSGCTPRLNEDAIAEYVLFDYTLGAEELLADTVVLDDAQVVDLDSRGAHTWSYWPLAERVAPGPPTSSRDLRTALGDAVEAYGRVPGVALGLTAGRDSVLVAQMASDLGMTLSTFTFGEPWYADARGARAVATSLGWHHTTVLTDFAPHAWSEMAALSVWSEGMQPGATLKATSYRWRSRDVAWLAGSGGEIARAFYWSRAGSPEAWVRHVRERTCSRFEPTAAKTLRTRFDSALERLDALGRPADDRPDLFYAVGRMGKWLARHLPAPQIRDVLPAYLTPAVVRCLLDVPLDGRRTGGLFDEALADSRLRQLALRRGNNRPGLKAPLLWWRGRVHERVLNHLLANVPHEPVTKAVLGTKWWDAAADRPLTTPWERREAWNVVAVEALAARLG